MYTILISPWNGFYYIEFLEPKFFWTSKSIQKQSSRDLWNKIKRLLKYLLYAKKHFFYCFLLEQVVCQCWNLFYSINLIWLMTSQRFHHRQYWRHGDLYFRRVRHLLLSGSHGRWTQRQSGRRRTGRWATFKLNLIFLNFESTLINTLYTW